MSTLTETMLVTALGLGLWRLGARLAAAIDSRIAESKRKADRAVLAYLAEQPCCAMGMDMVRAGLGKRGTIYIHLASLEDRGLIVSKQQATGLRIYSITEAGRALLEGGPRG